MNIAIASLFGWVSSGLCLVVMLAGSARAAEPVALFDPAAPAYGWRFGDGPEFPGATGALSVDADVTRNGVAALKLHGDFSRGGGYVEMGRRLATPLAVDRLAFWIRYPGSDTLKIRLVDGAQQVHQFDWVIPVSDDWQHVVLPVKDFFTRLGTPAALPGVRKFQSWGGAKDGVWRGPLTAIYLLNRAVDKAAKSGVLWISDFVLYAAEPVPVGDAPAAPAGMAANVALDEFLREGEVDWEFGQGSDFKGKQGALAMVTEDGAPAYRVEADFNPGGAYVVIKKSLRHLGVQDTTAFRFRMKSAGARVFNVRLTDSTGQAHQRKRRPLPADGGWHEVVIRPDEIVGVEHWGGANDGRWHGPAHEIALTLTRESAPDLKPAFLMKDMSVDVIQPARPGGAPALREDFEASADLPAGWVTEGEAAVTEDAFKGGRALRLSQPESKAAVFTPSSASSAPFAAGPGEWEITGAFKSTLHSPDNSYHGMVLVEWLDGAGAVLGRSQVDLLMGEQPWRAFRGRVAAPDGVARARLRCEIAKSYGTFLVDELAVTQLEGAAPDKRIDRVLLSTDQLGNLLYPTNNRVMHLALLANKPLPPDQRGGAYTVHDYWGAQQGGSLPFTVEKVGAEAGRMKYQATLDLSTFPLETGKYYEVHVEIPRSNSPPYTEFSALAILPEAAANAYPHAEIPFTSRNWDNRFREYFFLTRRLGVRVVGVWNEWVATPPYYRPRFAGGDWAKDLDLSVLARSAGFMIEQHRKGYEEFTPEILREGARVFAAAFITNGVSHLSLGNEPHGDFEKVKENVAAYREIYLGAKAGAPDMVVIGTAVGPEEDYFRAGFQAYQDVYDFHTYSDYQGIRKVFQRYEELFEKYGGRKPILSTEIGLNSQGLTRQVVARDVIRKITVFFACGGVNVSWFGLLFPDRDGKIEGSFGQAHNLFYSRYARYNPKLDAIAYYNMVNGIAVKKFVQERAYDDGSAAFLFRDTEGNCLQVLWNDKGSQAHFIPLRGVREVDVVRIDGSRRGLDAAGRGLTLDIGEDPVLLLYTQAAGELPERLDAPALRLASELRPAVKGAQVEFELAGEGLVPEVLAVQGPPGWPLRVAAAGAGRVRLSVTVPEATKAREGRLRIRYQPAGAPQGEFDLALPIASRIEGRLLPLVGAAGPALRLTLRNNGNTPQSLNWAMSFPASHPMRDGSYILEESTPTDARFSEAADGVLQLDAGAESSVEVPVQGLDPATIYRVKANVVDAEGRRLEVERLVAGFAVVPRAAAPPRIDGVIDEAAWARASVLKINETRQFTFARKTSNWTGPEDLSADIRLLWDDAHLYLSVQVKDDVFRNLKRDGDIWAGDGIQFILDPARSASQRIGLYDYAVASGAGGLQAWCFQTADQGAAPAGAVMDFQVAAVPASDGTGGMSYELAIPWSRIAPFQPAVGANLGLALILNEDDGNDRDSFMGWFSGVHLKQVDMAGDLILAE
ncbi:MAG TPA: sugar-binding protein [Kiritimatiellia bacterium]|nr:sugar-binding protein [Kiritimatiellia bacterium]